MEIPPALSEKVLKDKRKKLRETLDRVLKLYEKENPEYWVEIRRMVADYEKKRATLIEYYEAVKHAQAVTIDEIPLPNLDMPAVGDEEMAHIYGGIELPSIPPPMEGLPPSMPHSILKKQILPQQPPVPGEELMGLPPVATVKLPPGCPPTLPPELSDDEDFELPAQHRAKKIRFEDEEGGRDGAGSDAGSDVENNANSDDELRADDESNENGLSSKKSQGLTSLQAKLLQLSGQDVDQFVRKSEVLMQEKEADKQADLQKRLSKLIESDRSKSSSDKQALPPGESSSDSVRTSLATSDAPPSHPLPVAPPGVLYTVAPPVGVPPVPVAPPSGMSQIPSMFRPPPPRPGLPPPPPMAVRLPPGPPPQNLPQMPPQGMPPRLPNMRLPPPVRGLAPPGIVPRPAALAPSSGASNVLTAAPQLVPRPARHSQQTATIQAKPQIRNLSADVTRFLPTALRVKREDKKKGTKTGESALILGQSFASNGNTLLTNLKGNMYGAKMKTHAVKLYPNNTRDVYFYIRCPLTWDR